VSTLLSGSLASELKVASSVQQSGLLAIAGCLGIQSKDIVGFVVIHMLVHAPTSIRKTTPPINNENHFTNLPTMMIFR
jgi:hypothetical protein